MQSTEAFQDSISTLLLQAGTLVNIHDEIDQSLLKLRSMTYSILMIDDILKYMNKQTDMLRHYILLQTNHDGVLLLSRRWKHLSLSYIILNAKLWCIMGNLSLIGVSDASMQLMIWGWHSGSFSAWGTHPSDCGPLLSIWSSAHLHDWWQQVG